jgi:NAD+ synthase (glutamine-hydrolysing)
LSAEFFNFFNHGFVRVAVAVPEVRVADPKFNVERTTEMMHEAAASAASLVVFPELGLSSYSCDDLFHQRALLDAVKAGLGEILSASEQLDLLVIAGAPLVIEQRLFNCGVVLQKGRILGVVPKVYLPNYREFYESRQFNPAQNATVREIELCGQSNIAFGSDVIFSARNQPLLRIHVEICEDLWTPIPPSSYAALAGASVLVNLSASNITIAKSEYRHELVANQSARCLAAYLYSAAGTGESTTDLAWDGQALIYENGNMIAESERFVMRSHLVVSEIDLDRLAQERMRQTSFGEAVRQHKQDLTSFRTVAFDVAPPAREHLLLSRHCARFPYVPADERKRDARCSEIYQIQSLALAKRMLSAGIQKLVIGVSGGLDSTQALIVAAHAVDLLGLPRANILGFTMPGFATSGRTLKQSHELMAAMKVSAREISIKESAMQMLRDIRHPYAKGEEVFDVTFENVQAGERTSHLFRLANLHNALVVGTGDLSELALGWCTYGVGDHMSHYSVNASVPKTLIQYLVRWVAQSGQFGDEVSRVLLRILDTHISPELVPGKDGGGPAQKSEDIIGPYELQDFNLYHTLRFGFSPSKVAYLSYCAWHDRERGTWPAIAPGARRQYTIGEIKKYLGIFLYRFFKTSQFKRSCIPNAPKVGSGGSLSPRGDWRAPSDSEATAWLDDLNRVPEQET